MSETALLVRDDARLGIAISAAGLKLRQAALELAALIGRVSNAEEQLAAVNAQKALVEFRTAVEKSRKLVKDPVIQFGRLIDDTAKRAVEETSAEEIRVTKLIADFQALEMARIRAAQAAENARLAEIEREKQAALAQAKTHEELDAVQEEFNQKAQEAQPKPMLPIPRVAGQMIKEVWDYEILNLPMLYAHHPDLVTLEPKRREILAALESGITVQGIKPFKVTKAGIRL